MCGFVFTHEKHHVSGNVGWIARERARVRDMAAAIVHRGPDEYGELQLGSALMAHRRLSVIDLVGGQQPMTTPDGTFAVVYNGEIYNYKEVARILRGRGHNLTGKSDTEVLLAAYVEWGEGCLDHLNGMFAFVIYDKRKNRVFAARDRFGEKPLYYCETDDAFYFASELKALFVGGVFEPKIDPLGLYWYFVYNYVRGPGTIFRGVHKLLPGHALRIEAGSCKVWPYWTPQRGSPEITDEREGVRLTHELLRDSVEKRMISDVPLGFFLSGGVDSSAIVALAQDVSDTRLETFGIGFEETIYDERPYQRFVAKRFGINHHEIVLTPQSLDVIEELAWHLDEPFADPAALPVWYLAEHARESVTVALTGDGGDEMFAGYDSYRGHILSERLRYVPSFIRNAAISALRRLPATDAARRERFDRLAQNIADVELPARIRLNSKHQQGFRRERLALMSDYLSQLCVNTNDRAQLRVLYDDTLSPLEAFALFHQHASLTDQMLVKTDRTSMAHSLELRTPFLDHRLAELANRIALRTHMCGGKTKYILKRVMENYFPKGFLWRRKQGFVIPMTYWFKEDLGRFAQDRILASDSVVTRIIDRDSVAALLAEHRSLARDHSRAVWTLLMFEVWCRKYGLTADALAEEQTRTPELV